MDDPKYEIYFNIERLARPIGDLQYVAKPKLYVRESPTSVREVRAPFAETYGVTREEAESKGRELIKEWIAKRKGGDSQTSNQPPESSGG